MPPVFDHEYAKGLRGSGRQALLHGLPAQGRFRPSIELSGARHHFRGGHSLSGYEISHHTQNEICSILLTSISDAVHAESRACCQASSGGPVGAWGSSVAWFQEDQGASSALFSYHRLVPVSALVPARHPQPARCHCGQGTPHHHLPSHGRYNVDKPSFPTSLVSVVHYRSLGIKPQFPDRPGYDPSQRKYCTAVGKESVQYRSRAMTDYGCSAVVFELRGRGVGAHSLAENGRTEDSVF